MKILHTSDWYLGNTFYGHDRTVEHRHFLSWLLNILRQQVPDVLVVTGNVFDSSQPSAMAEQLLYDFLLEATEAVRGLQIVMISGNRDSSGKLEMAAQLLKRHNIYVRGAVKYTDEGKIDFDHLILPLSSRFHTEAELVCMAIPYLRANDYPEGMTQSEGLQYYFENTMRQLRKSDFRKLPVVAAAHFLTSGVEVSDMERREWWTMGGQESINPQVVGRGLSYVALGNIHRGQRVDCDQTEMYYAGSALPMAFPEAALQYGLQMVELEEDGRCQISRIPYEPLRRLMVVPEEGTATVKEVFDAIRELPKRKKNESGDAWPYLEIRLQTRQVEPDLMHEVNEELMDRAVHYCNMVRQGLDTAAGENMFSRRHALEDLAPLEMAKTIFESRYHGDMPEELIMRFREAEQLLQDASSL